MLCRSAHACETQSQEPTGLANRHCSGPPLLPARSGIVVVLRNQTIAPGTVI